MLQFFRKYQKILFIFITVVVVISFSFFGTYSTFFAPVEKDHVVGKAVDGSNISFRELDCMVRFLNSERYHSSQPNCFNEGVIERDFLATGMGMILIERYFNDFRDELEKHFKKHKHFQPYVHHELSFLSSENVWAHFNPSLKADLDRFMKEDTQFDLSGVSLLMNLYLDEARFPSHRLKQFLLYQQNEYVKMLHVHPDPRLQSTSLALFNCQSVSDWFGPKFVEYVARFIHNAAIIARSKGYSVTKEEAHSNLLLKGIEGLKSYGLEENVEENLSYFLAGLHMDEDAATRVWQKVMLCRRLFQDVGNHVLLDPLIYEQFQGFTSKQIEVDLYEIPHEYKLSDFESLLKMQVYLEAVTPKKVACHPLDVPNETLSLDQLERKQGELVSQDIVLEMVKVKLDDLTMNVGLKETWDWQIEANNFELLRKQFREIAHGVNQQERYEILEKLDENMRYRVDHFARLAIVGSHPQWIDEAMHQATPVKKEIALSMKNPQIPFEGIQDIERVASLLKTAPLHQHTILIADDGSTHYQIQILERKDKRILSCVEASGVLDTLLQEKLEQAYPKIRLNHPKIFQESNGEWKTLSEVKKEVGRFLYADLLKSIEQEVIQAGGALSKGTLQEPFEFYVRNRFLHYLKGAKEAFEEGTWQDRWQLEHRSQVIFFNQKNTWIDEALFGRHKNEISEICTKKDGELCFYQVKRDPESPLHLNSIKEGQGLLAKDAKCYFMQQLLDQIDANVKP